MTLGTWIGYGFAGLAVIAIAYQLIALVAVWRYFDRPAPMGSSREAVTLLKPLHGAEPELCTNLATFLAQDHAGPVQIVCGVGTPDDKAVAAVAALQAAHPQAEIAFATGPLAPGSNAKIGSVAAMMPLARHDILVLSDSDIAVRPHYLSMLLVALDQQGTGAVTCLYTGRGDAGLWSQISAAAISYTGLPNMVMALATSIAQPCLGSTIAIRRETLDQIGGFARFADVLADDYAIGEAVAALGLKVAVPPMLLTHACAHRSLSELWRQHLRWSATIRGVAPMRHAGSGVTHALAFALLCTAFLPLPGAIILGCALAVRLLLAAKVNALSPVRGRCIWLLPLADMLEFGAFLASFVTRAIDWRGSQLTISGKGRIALRNPSLSDIQ